MEDAEYLKEIKILEDRIKELENQNNLFRKILSQLPLGIQVFDEKGVSLMMNNKQGELLGVPDLITGIGKFNVLTDPFTKATGVVEIYKKAYEGIPHEHIFEYNLGMTENTWDTRKDSRIFKEKIVPVSWTHEKIEHVLAILEDITEKQRAEEELRNREQLLKQLNETKDKLFSIIAHDLRSPFIALISMNEIVSGKIDNNDTDGAKHVLKLIQNSSHQVLNLLDNLLQWSRIQTGRLEFIPMKIDFEAIVEHVDDLLKANYIEKNIQLKISVEKELEMYADQNMIETILRNLLSNAIKFTQVGGTIEIKANKKAEYVEISVIDNGIGITANHMDKLFSLNSNLTTLGTQFEKGTGLGLVLCKEFVEKHGGKIWVDSKEKEGSCFSFTIRNNS